MATAASSGFDEAEWTITYLTPVEPQHLHGSAGTEVTQALECQQIRARVVTAVSVDQWQPVKGRHVGVVRIVAGEGTSQRKRQLRHKTRRLQREPSVKRWRLVRKTGQRKRRDAVFDRQNHPNTGSQQWCRAHRQTTAYGGMSEGRKDAQEKQHERAQAGRRPQRRKARRVVIEERIDDAVGAEREFEGRDKSSAVDEHARRA